jgi:hypothetical protein
MAVTVVLDNGGGPTYTFSVTPGVVITKSTITKEDNTDLQGVRVKWVLTGHFISPDGNLATQKSILETYLVTRVLTTAEIKDGAATLEAMPTDGSIEVTDIEYPEGTGVEWATIRRFKITLEATDWVAAVVSDGMYNYKIEYNTQQSTLQTRRISGTLEEHAGGSSFVNYGALKTAQGWETWSGANKISESTETNEEDTITTFTLIHEKYWEAFPSLITNASVSTETAIDDQDVVRKRATGWFEGPLAACEAAINGLISFSDVIINDSRTRSTYDNRTTFRLDLINALGDVIMEKQESVTMTPSVYDFAMRPVIGGASPVKQYTVRRPAKAVQFGVIKQLKRPPTEPVPIWGTAHLKQKTVTSLSAEVRTKKGEAVYGLQYSYTFEFSTDPR